MEYQKREQDQEAIRAQTESEKRIAERKAKELSDALKRVQQERERYSFLVRLLLGAIVATVGTGAVLILPPILSWKWLIQHSHKLGLQVGAILDVLGISWIIIDTNKKRRWFALGSIVLASIITMIEIL